MGDAGGCGPAAERQGVLGPAGANQGPHVQIERLGGGVGAAGQGP